MRLFNRQATIIVDTAVPTVALKIPCGKDGFDCFFDIHKDLTGKPNRGTIKVYNLTPAHRDSLSERAAKGPVRVRLDAGYEEGVSRIFEGDMRFLNHNRDSGADVVTTIETGDGDRLIATARLSRAWGPGTPVTQVIKDLAAALGVGEGNIRGSTAGAVLEAFGPTFTGGTAVCGQVIPALERICKSAGISFSIQDGSLTFLVGDRALGGTAVSVTASTGMEDAPKVDHKGRLRVKTRIIPDIFPGRKIVLEDRSVWRVDKARYHGETRGNAWNIDIQARPA